MRRIVCGDGKAFDKKSSVTSILVKLSVLSLVCMLVLPILLSDRDSIRRIFANGGCFGSSETNNNFGATNSRGILDSAPISRLIDDIRHAVRVAAGGADVSFSAEDRRVWEKFSPCKSRDQLENFYLRRKGVKYTPVSQRWQKVLDEYAVLHRVCMSRIGDLKEYVLRQNETVGCKFVVAETHFGLGNKFYHISSLLVFAVLTQRVILIPGSTFVPGVVCEPFPGSSWALNTNVHRLLQANRNTADQLFAGIDESISTRSPLNAYASEGGGVWGPSQRFWCDTEQTYLRNVTWLTFDGCLYHLPRLFSVPTFRPVLEAMFSDRAALTHVLRTAMLPADRVWNRVLYVQNEYLKDASKQIGLQVRVFQGQRQYNKDKVTINEHVSNCLWKNNFIPQLCGRNNVSCSENLPVQSSNSSSTALTNPPNSSNAVTKVFIASLFDGFRNYLEEMYRQHETTTGERVDFVQLTENGRQGQGILEDTGALVEVLTLSFSDVLLVTPLSTFGGLALGYGAQIPYFIEYNMTAGDACQRGVSREPCCLGASPHYECRHDPTQYSEVGKSVPYLTNCVRIEIGPHYGMLLRTNNAAAW